MKHIITKLYLKGFSIKNRDRQFIINARIATDNMLSGLKNMGLCAVEYKNYGIQLTKSPYSKSCYFQVRETENENLDCPIWVIRISNHMPNQLPPNCILNILTGNGDFIFNKTMQVKIKKMIKELSCIH